MASCLFGSWSSIRSCPDRLLHLGQEVDDPLQQQLGGVGVVGGQRTVGEVVLITWVQEQLGTWRGLDDGTGCVDVTFANEDRVGVHAVDCTGTSVGHDTPNSETGTHE